MSNDLLATFLARELCNVDESPIFFHLQHLLGLTARLLWHDHFPFGPRGPTVSPHPKHCGEGPPQHSPRQRHGYYEREAQCVHAIATVRPNRPCPEGEHPREPLKDKERSPIEESKAHHHQREGERRKS